MSRVAEVIVPLDTPSAEEALAIVDRLGPAAGFYKVGLELYTSAGPAVVSELISRRKRVFLDLKLHDIPNTVSRAARAAASLGVDLLTVHSSGGVEMVRAACDAVEGRAKVLAVTALTSLSRDDLSDVWGRPIESMADEVLRLAELAAAAGADGVVASAAEAARIRAHMEEGFLLVVPGIRPSGADHQDQKRVATPADAVRAGADYLVIGRPITGAADPRAALDAVLAEVEGATSALA